MTATATAIRTIHRVTEPATPKPTTAPHQTVRRRLRTLALLAVLLVPLCSALIPTPAGAQTDRPDRLKSGERLLRDQAIWSRNGRYKLVMQGEGNLVLYHVPSGQALWGKGPIGNEGASVVMQGDGNLVIYAADGEYIWDSATDGNPGAVLVLADDGNLIIYARGGDVLWVSNTGAHTLDCAAAVVELNDLVDDHPTHDILYRTGSPVGTYEFTVRPAELTKCNQGSMSVRFKYQLKRYWNEFGIGSTSNYIRLDVGIRGGVQDDRDPGDFELCNPSNLLIDIDNYPDDVERWASKFTNLIFDVIHEIDVCAPRA